MKNKIAHLRFAFLFMSGVLMAVSGNAAELKPPKVVYHIGEAGPAQIKRAIRYIMNQSGVSPDSKIVVVAHAQGVESLLKDARDENGSGIGNAIGELASRGVSFRVCNISLVNQDIERSALVPEATVVRSGVEEITRLQNEQGYAYIRP